MTEDCTSAQRYPLLRKFITKCHSSSGHRHSTNKLPLKRLPTIVP